MRRAMGLLAMLAGAPTSGSFKVGQWREFNPVERHATHQTSELGKVRSNYRAEIAPYQHIPLERREPDKLPPYAPTASTPECVEVYQAGRSLSARNQEETCADWALGMYWMEDGVMHGDRSVWVKPSGTSTLRYVEDDPYGWWIHRDSDRHGYACMGEESEAESADPLGCTGFGHRHWSPCRIRRCADRAGADGSGGSGIEAKLRRLRTKELRDWAQALGLAVTRSSRRDDIVKVLREELYKKDGHLVLDPYDAFLETANNWAAARAEEQRALEAAELAKELAEAAAEAAAAEEGGR